MPRQRPVSVLVLAVFCFIIGGIGVLTNTCGLISFVGGSALTTAFQPPSQQQQTRELEQQMYTQVPYYRAYMAGMGIAVPVLFTAALITAGLGLLHMRMWAWRLAIVYAVLSILHKIGEGLYTFLFITPIMKAWFRHFMESQPAGPPQAQRMMAQMATWMETWTTISSIGTPIVKTLFPIVVLIILLRPSVIDAFRGKAEPDGLPADS